MRKRRIITISMAALMLVSLCAVCASTGVTAATNSGGTQASLSQAKITDVVGTPPGGLDSAPAVCSWGPGRLDVFARGTDGDLWHTWWDGTWHSWENLGPPNIGLNSAPSAVSWGAGRIDVFANSDGFLVHKWFDERYGGWHDWESLGVPTGNGIITAPAACSWGANRLDIFVMGSDGQLWQKWFYNGWQSWVPLGQPSTANVGGSPGAFSSVSWGYPRVDIFMRGADGALWQLWWKNGWQPWHKFDDTAGLVASSPENTQPGSTGYYGNDFYAPAVCSWGANRLDVFFVDTSGHLQQKWWNGAWQPLYNVGGNDYLSAGSSAVTWKLGTTTRIDIFARSTGFSLYQLYWAAGSDWSYWWNLGLIYPV